MCVLVELLSLGHNSAETHFVVFTPLLCLQTGKLAWTAMAESSTWIMLIEPQPGRDRATVESVTTASPAQDPRSRWNSSTGGQTETQRHRSNSDQDQHAASTCFIKPLSDTTEFRKQSEEYFLSQTHQHG